MRLIKLKIWFYKRVTLICYRIGRADMAKNSFDRMVKLVNLRNEIGV